MKETTKAERRHQLARMKARWRIRLTHRTPGMDPQELIRRVGLHANTGAVCSCWMCGNPRKVFAEPSIDQRRKSQSRFDADD